mmetsp:Transcript_21218/g.61756  ORF Transcript_21218/g.61756 Transcript_21218/m.61756 type:complete len:559 (+) Transcript_21218:635-2311(+)
MFQGHVIVGTQAEARPHDVDHGAPLSEEGIDHRSAAGDQGRLEHVTQQRQHRMESFPLLLPVLLDRDAFAQFSQDDQIVNERGGQQRIFARVVHHDGILPSHEYLGRVFVHGALGIGDVRHVLDNYHVIGMFVLVEQNAIRRDHIVHHVGLGNFLGAELGRRAQVLAVVVAEMIVRYDGYRLDPGRYEEVDQYRLHLGLTGFEIISGDEDLVLPCEFEHTGDEGILGGTVDVGASLEYGSDGKDGGGRHLGLAPLDTFHEILGGIVDALLDARETFRIGRPQNDDLVERILLLEFANVLLDLFHLFLLRTRQYVIGAFSLIGGDEIGKVDGGEGIDVLHVRVQLLLKIDVEHLAPFHGVAQIGLGDVPSSPHNVVGFDHGEHVGHGRVDGISLGIVAQLDRRGHHDGTPIVGLLGPLLGFPRDPQLVGDGSGDARAAVVTAESDEHDADLPDLALGLELHLGLHGLDYIALHDGRFVSIIRDDLIVAVLALVRLDGEVLIEVLHAAHGYFALRCVALLCCFGKSAGRLLSVRELLRRRSLSASAAEVRTISYWCKGKK